MWLGSLKSRFNELVLLSTHNLFDNLLVSEMFSHD